MRARIGHNRPPLPVDAEIRQQLAQDHAELFGRRDEILAGAKRFLEAYPEGIPDDAVQGKAGDFVGSRGSVIARYLQAVTAMHAAEKRPWLDGAAAIDGVKKILADPVTAVRTQIQHAMNLYAALQEEERRRALREAAEAQAARAIETSDNEGLQDAVALAQQAQEATVADMTRVTGELGTVVSMRTRWVFDEEASDLMKLVKAVAAGKAPLRYLAFATTNINHAVRSEKIREIPGCVIKEERHVV